MNALKKILGKHGDIAIAVFVFGILFVLFVPVHKSVLDFLILLNFSFAFLILLLTFYINKPVEFSTFPSLLLVATLFRLSLNVAATRLILSDGDAGRVIGAIGAYVVGGNYVIGLIVFLILIVVQYVVITSGAQRVSEVAARFTLDSMPGQQMSIDADLNMGFIDQAEAQRRRKNIEKEAGFYGAMDGASKFVKGDAIAGIIIMLINIIGGLLIGVMQMGMPWADALRTYTLLTIGDGIVTQVPALVIAVATGIIVTRSASDNNLSEQVFKQITSFPKSLVLLGLVLFGLLLMPGIPLWPVAILLSGLSLLTWWIIRLARQVEAEKLSSVGQADGLNQGEGVSQGGKLDETDPYAALALEPVEVHAGRLWAASVNNPDDVIVERIATFRRQYAIDLGFVLPRVRFREITGLGDDHYEIHMDGVLCARGQARVDKILAIHPSGDTGAIQGEITRDPTYGLPAVWISEEQREQALALKYTLVDSPTVLLTHLTEVLRRESATLLTRSEVDKLLSRIRKEQATLVEELIPTILSISDVQKVLQNLLREKVSIRNMEAILETLADAGRSSKDTGYLTEVVRLRLGRAICQGLLGENNTLHVITMSAPLEVEFLQQLHAAMGSQKEGASTSSGMVLDPKMTETFISKLMMLCERMMKSNLLPVLLCSPELRRHMRTLSERAIPHLRVLSMTEIPSNIELKSFGVVPQQV